MKLYNVYVKMREQWIRLHTRMAGRALGGYGGGGRIESPVNLINPQFIHVGKNFVLSAYAMLACIREWGGVRHSGNIRIGDDVIIREDVQITSAVGVSIGNNVGVSRGVVIADNSHGFTPVDSWYVANPLENLKEVVIEDDCFIGAYTYIAPGVRIGRKSVIGIGASVTRDVPPHSMLVGSPARVIKNYNHESCVWEKCPRPAHDKANKGAP